MKLAVPVVLYANPRGPRVSYGVRKSAAFLWTQPVETLPANQSIHYDEVLIPRLCPR